MPIIKSSFKEIKYLDPGQLLSQIVAKMMLPVVATFATLCALLGSSAQESSIRTDLKITAGVCEEPREDDNSCKGLSTRGGESEILFHRLGRTESALLANKWKKRDRGIECDNDGKFNGYRWMDPLANPISHALLLDKNGIVAGMQFMMPYSEVELNAELKYRFDKQPAIQNETISGISYFYITVYFIDPNQICSVGRDESRLETEGTVSQFYIQIGPSPNHVKQISLTSPPRTASEKELLAGWSENNCYDYMGWHRFYNQGSWNDDKCTSFLPIFLMYSNEGELNGFGFMVPGRSASPSVEKPSTEILQWTSGTKNATDSVPQCLKELHDAVGLSSMHVFFTQRPDEFICSSCDSKTNQTHISSTVSGFFSNPRKMAAKTWNWIVDIFHKAVSLVIPSPAHHGITTESSQSDDLPICVIGAGLSGIGIALELEKLGRSVEVFEKNSVVGGKIKTFRQGDQLQVEMGPLLISPMDKLMNGFIKEFGLSTINFDTNDLWGYAIENMYPKQLLLNSTTEDHKKIADAAKKYIQLIMDTSKIDFSNGYLNTSPNLFVTMSKWLKKNKLYDDKFRSIITLLTTPEGFGYVEDVPAIYILQLLDKYTMESFVEEGAKPFLIVKEGLDFLIEKIASKLTKKVNLNYEVTKITRNGNYQTVEFNNSQTKNCSEIILAFPPLLPTVEKIIDLDGEERNVLEQIRIHKYTSVALKIPSWNYTTYVEALPEDYPNNNGKLRKPEGKGEVTFFLKQTQLEKQQNIYSAYSWIKGDFDTIPNASDLELIKSKLQQSLQKIDEQGSGKSEILNTENAEYFPHVSSKNLKSGFYKKFDKIQGKRGIYYGTTLLTFESMEKALEMAKLLAPKIVK